MRGVHNVERRINTAKLDVNSYPFKCNKCEFVAKRSEHLKVHNKAKHEDFEAVRFDCLLCDKKFLYSSTLKRNNKKHHYSLAKDIHLRLVSVYYEMKFVK